MKRYFLFVFILSGIIACNKFEEFDYAKSNIKAVSTLGVSGVTRNTAVMTAKINTTNGKSITSLGVCYSTTSKPTVSGDTTGGNYTDNTRQVLFSNLKNLAPETKYYARPFVTNSYGTAYGEEISFTTLKAALATIITGTPENVALNSVIIGGIITDNGGYPVTERGVAYSASSQNPGVNHSTVVAPNTVSSFKVTLPGLVPGTRYYARAYAITQAGVGYGQAITFTTVQATPPGNVTTMAISNITISGATGGGNIGNDGGTPVTAKGVVYSNTNTSPLIGNGIVLQASGGGIGPFSVNFTGLTPNTTYYVRAYATNNSGTTYGPVIQFRTLQPDLPSGITTLAISNIGMTTATGGGSVTVDGGAPITARGLCYSSVTTVPTITNSTIKQTGSGLGTFNTTLNDLAPNTLYYVRAYATNSTGTSYGPMIQFRTLAPSLPGGVSTNSITNISHNSAQGGGFITSDGGSTVTSRGICFSSTTNAPTIQNSTVVLSGSGTGVFSANLSGLQPNTTYYVRAFATNVRGTAYGNVLSFKTTYNLSVGASYQGGTIAYIFRAGEPGYKAGEVHGIIVSSSISQQVWGCHTISISTSSVIGTGNDNTTKIVNACAGNNAARYAYNLVTGGYSDWYLPSYNELQQIHANKALLSIPEHAYWSSTQDVTNSQAAYAVHFQGNYYVNYPKNGVAYVLPVRRF